MILTKYFTIATLLLTARAGLSTSPPYLVGIAQGFSARGEIVQGWALVENLCPDGTGTCGRRSCCPLGSYCDATEATNSNLCCPTRTGCASDVSKADRCAQSNWVEWFTIKDPICCLPGEIGVQPGSNDYYGSCASAGSNIASSLLASTVRSASTAQATTAQATTAQATNEPTPSTASTPTLSTGSSNSAPLSPTSTTASLNPASASSSSASTHSSPTPTSSSSASMAAASIELSLNPALIAIVGVIGGVLGILAI